MRVLIAPAAARARVKIAEPLERVGVEVEMCVASDSPRRRELLGDLFASLSRAAMTAADVVLTDMAMTFPAVAAGLGASLRGRPFVLRPRGDWWQEHEDLRQRGKLGLAGGAWAIELFEGCFSKAAAILPVSETLKQMLLEHVDLDSERMTPVPVPINTERFRPAADPAAIKRELGYDYEHVVALVTNFAFLKKVAAVERFLPVLRRLVEEREDTAVVIAGGGDLRADFIARNREVFEHARLLAPGYVSDVERLYQCSDFVPFFSFLDACPNVPLEAWACETPVVVNDYAPLMEHLREGETGYVVGNNADPEECLPIFNRLLDDPQLRRTMGERGRRIVMETFTPEIIGQRLARALESVL